MFMETHTYSTKTFQKRSIRSQIGAKEKVYITRGSFRGKQMRLRGKDVEPIGAAASGSVWLN